jgi:c-di-GMP-binding flagellar brake protein YcgR
MRDPYGEPVSGPSGRRDDRRNYTRVPFHKSVTVEALPDGPTIEARTIDISLGGVGITCRAAFSKGQSLAVVFRLDDRKLGACVERVPGRVVNLVADEGCNRVGVEFAESLHEAKFPALSRAVARL